MKHVLTVVLNILKLSLHNDSIQHGIELSVLKTGENFIFLNKKKKRTAKVAFIFPLNEHFSISATQSLFKEFVCYWVFCVSDCYLLHSSPIYGPFDSFKCNSNINVVNDSDVDIESAEDGHFPHPGSSSAADQLERDLDEADDESFAYNAWPFPQ